MNKRVKELRKSKNLNQEEFGNRLGVGKSAISYLESGRSKLTEQMILSMCREFNVNENWLRYGKGEMFEDLSEDEEMMVLIGKLCADGNVFKKRALMAAAKIIDNDDVWSIIENELKNMIDKKEE